jgi:hypothetical protein
MSEGGASERGTGRLEEPAPTLLELADLLDEAGYELQNDRPDLAGTHLKRASRMLRRRVQP